MVFSPLLCCRTRRPSIMMGHGGVLLLVFAPTLCDDGLSPRFLLCHVRNKLDIVQTDVVDDPTLQRSKNAICEKCNYNEAVFFQADEVRCAA